MTQEKAPISVRVDVTNPGQFFACCGLLELASRLWPEAEGWFGEGVFNITAKGSEVPSLTALIDRLKSEQAVSDDPNADDKTCPIRLGSGFGLRIDWWLDKEGAGRLKTWAGQQSVLKIARSMQQELPTALDEQMLDDGKVTMAPYYFDSRRFAHALDAGFSLDEQQMEVVAYPAVELLALIGLQRFRPAVTNDRWTFCYHSWSDPLAPAPASAVCSGAIGGGQDPYHFRVRFRDDQKRFKAFTRATLKQQIV